MGTRYAPPAWLTSASKYSSLRAKGLGDGRHRGLLSLVGIFSVFLIGAQLALVDALVVIGFLASPVIGQWAKG